jgi:GntR family transcriptional regulator, transcriptional repressor for pyruvate dehydrogenase complex
MSGEDDAGVAAPDAGGPAASALAGFAPVARNERLSDKVAEELLRSITTHQLVAGTRLPSERELGEQFGVSRTVIREAVRSLAAKGVLEVRAGSGVHVAAVDAASVSQQMALFLRGRGLDYAKIHEVRVTLEIRTARLAAERATDEDIAELREHCERMAALEHDVEAASMADVEFHRAVARATHNELFVVMLDSIGDILLEIRRVTLGVPDRFQDGVDFHRRILDRVAAHDVDGAAQAMREHLEDADAAWRTAGASGPTV